MRIAGRFKVDVNFTAFGKSIGVLFFGAFKACGEFVGRIAIKHFNGNVQVARLGVPVVDQLIGSAIDVATGDDNIVTSKHVGQDGVNRRHAAVKVPSKVLTCILAGAEIDDMIGQADAGWVE